MLTLCYQFLTDQEACQLFAYQHVMNAIFIKNLILVCVLNVLKIKLTFK